MKLMVANDIGNSETKMIVNKGQIFRQPSIIKTLLTLPTAVETDVKKNIANLLDELVVSISSKSIRTSGAYAIGNKANGLGGTVENMNIRLGNKHLHDIPVIMTLSLLAAKAVQMDFEENQKLSTNLSVNVKMSTAIPASEYKPDNAKLLEQRFTGAGENREHVVSVYVGNEIVQVIINFNEVKVTQEGNPAIYTIGSGEQDILRLYNEQYKKSATPKEFRNKKVFHSDIGDGTTEYIYTIGANPKNDASTGERRGVGHATEEALKLFTEQLGVTINYNRHRFMNVLRDTNHNFHNEAIKCMDLAKQLQSRLIFEDIKDKYLDKTSGDVELFTVYGGGSIQFKEALYEDLIQFAESVNAEVLWIPEEYAVDLNVRGLQVLNENVFFKKG